MRKTLKEFIVLVIAVFAGITLSIVLEKQDSVSAQPNDASYISQINPNLTADQVNIIIQSAQDCSAISEIPVNVFLALWKVESDYDPMAIGQKGSIGIGQLNPRVWWFATFDLRDNLRGSCMVIINYYLRERGNLFKTLSRYNGGNPAFAEKVIKTIPEIGREIE